MPYRLWSMRIWAYVPTNSTDISYKEGVFTEITFKSTAPRVASFVLYEDFYGIDGYKSDSIAIETCNITQENEKVSEDSKGNGNVDVKDEVLLAQHLAGWDVKLK